MNLTSPFPITISIDGLATFFDACRFSAQITKIVKFRAANRTTAGNFDFRNTWRMQRECTLNANTIRNFSYGKCFTDSAALPFDNNTFKHLDTFTASFNNLNVHFNSVTWAEIRMIRTKLVLCHLINNMLHHGSLLPNQCSYHTTGQRNIVFDSSTYLSTVINIS